jgi:hypothetical protein
MGAGANSLGGGAIDLLGALCSWQIRPRPTWSRNTVRGPVAFFYRMCPIRQAGWLEYYAIRALAKRRSRADFADLLRALR